MSAAREDALPAIRSELRLVGWRRNSSGAEIGVVYDPLRHRFFELIPIAAEILRRWHTGSRAGVVAEIDAAATHHVAAEDVDAMALFLGHNQLLRGLPPPRQPSPWQRIEHAIGRMFFFRIPLVHPDRTLAVMADLLASWFGRKAILGLALAAIGALVLVARQWDLFAAGFRPVFSTGGAMALMVAVVLAKIAHELGHALAAKRMGCTVPAMGVAVMFGAPLLYTDLSDTWRLERRRDRLLVAASGILAETTLAVAATWGWLILPDGPARAACFFLATAAWMATLVININPFMRFDGYFMLSDLMGVPNLQQRAFALGRWVVRRLVWGTPEACEDDAAPLLFIGLLAYAWSTWLFRAGLFLGLALTAYHLLPKVVAVPLLAAELWVLLVRPIAHEATSWWRKRRLLLGTRHGQVTALLLLGLMVWLAVPQSFRLSLPAVLAPAERVWIYPPRAAQLVRHATPGALVAAGEVVAVFRDDSLDHQIARSHLRIDLLRATEEQVARDQHAARELSVVREQIAGEAVALAGYTAQQESLTLRAPFAGRIMEAAAGLRDGVWYGSAEPLFMVASAAGRTLIAFVDDRDLDLVRAGGEATFHPTPIDHPSVAARVAAVAAVPSEFIAEPLLASITGGPIATERDAAGNAVPRQGQYRVIAEPLAPPPPSEAGAIEGRLMVHSRPYSLLGLSLRRLHAILVREAGA